MIHFKISLCCSTLKKGEGRLVASCCCNHCQPVQGTNTWITMGVVILLGVATYIYIVNHNCVIEPLIPFAFHITHKEFHYNVNIKFPSDGRLRPCYVPGRPSDPEMSCVRETRTRRCQTHTEKKRQRHLLSPGRLWKFSLQWWKTRRRLENYREN